MSDSRHAREVTAELLARYDRPGPRYTSYPTVVEFHDGFTEIDYRSHLSRANELGDAPLSVYTHVPFCEEHARSWPYRADVDDRDMTMGRKIKVAEQEWVPYIAVVGDREVAGGDLHVRVRGADEFVGSRESLLAEMDRRAGDKPRKPLNTPRRLSLRPVFVG